MDGAKGVVTLSLSLKDGKTLDEPVRAEAEVLVVDPVLPGVHRYKRVADDVLEERARVDLAEDETERVRGGVGEHDELVARERLVEVQLVRRRLVVDELLVSVELASSVNTTEERMDEVEKSMMIRTFPRAS